MATDIRPEVSKRNPYYISRERYYELKHFCRQYPEWKKFCATFEPLQAKPSGEFQLRMQGFDRRPTESLVETMSDYKSKMDLVDAVLKETFAEDEQVVVKYLKLTVTEGFSYEYLRTALDIPMGRDMFYDRYRRFFYLLSKKR